MTAASYERAKQLFDAGKIDEAVADLQTVLAANPYDLNGLYLQAQCALAKGFLFGARETLTRSSHRRHQLWSGIRRALR